MNWQEVLFKEPDDEIAFAYPLNHALMAEFEDQTVSLIREYKSQGEFYRFTILMNWTPGTAPGFDRSESVGGKWWQAMGDFGCVMDFGTL